MKASDVAVVRMGRTGLSEPIFRHPVEVVSGHLAMQAQDFGPAKWAIGQRLGSVADADVEAEVSRGSILRTHVLRPTWHFVAAQDLPWLMALSGPRVQRSVEARYGQLGLDTKTRARAERVLSSQLLGGNHLTRKALGETLRRSRIEPDGQRLPHLLMHCELESVITSGPVQGKNQTYALFEERVPKGRHLDRDQAVVELVGRYLRSHGPATLKDMSWWSGLTMSELKMGLDVADRQVNKAEVAGFTIWWIGEPTPVRRRNPVVYLLQAYDEMVVGYTESRYLGDPRAPRARAAFSDRRLPNGLMMLNSRVAGHWRRSTSAKAVEVEVLLYEPLRRPAQVALERAVEQLGLFLGRRSRMRTAIL